jgi:hypothetical protein
MEKGKAPAALCATLRNSQSDATASQQDRKPCFVDLSHGSLLLTAQCLARISHHALLFLVGRPEGRGFDPAEKAASNFLFVSRPAQLVPTGCAGPETRE